MVLVVSTSQLGSIPVFRFVKKVPQFYCSLIFYPTMLAKLNWFEPRLVIVGIIHQMNATKNKSFKRFKV